MTLSYTLSLGICWEPNNTILVEANHSLTSERFICVDFPQCYSDESVQHISYQPHQQNLHSNNLDTDDLCAVQGVYSVCMFSIFYYTSSNSALVYHS